jgi:hypothetical protein
VTKAVEVTLVACHPALPSSLAVDTSSNMVLSVTL